MPSRHRVVPLVVLLLATWSTLPCAAVPALAGTPSPTLRVGQRIEHAPAQAPLRADAVAAIGTPLTIVPGVPGASGWGLSVSAAGDVNGDGYADFLASTAGPGANAAWSVALFYGSASGPVQPAGWVRSTYSHPAQVSAAGDVNNDGYDDVVIGAGSLTEGGGAGIVEVFMGAPGGLGASPGFTQSGDPGFGASVCAAGDVNGDGYDDLIVGDTPPSSIGSAILYDGSATGLSPTPAWTFTGLTEEGIGANVAGLGDVNGDGFDDIGVGSDIGWEYLTLGRVFIGGSSGPVYSSAFSIELERSAQMHPAGDVDGDGYADYWICQPVYDYPGDPPVQFSTAYLFQGGPTARGGMLYGNFSDVSSQLGGVAFTAGDFNGDGTAEALYGEFTGYLGLTSKITVIRGARGGSLALQGTSSASSADRHSACAAGDVNGDGFGDLIVGVPYRSSGELLLYYGRADQPTAATERLGVEDQALAGWSIATGDVNGDGFDDVAIGSPLADGLGYVDCGRVQLYLGSATGIAATPTWQGFGWQDNDQLGISLSIGMDVNGDGYGDIVAGAHAGDHVHTWLGSADWSLANDQPDWTLDGPQAGTYFGSSVALAGDVNGDGFADVLVGAPLTETITGGGAALFHHPQAGKAYLYSGSPSGLVGPVWSFTNNQDYAQCGLSVAAAGDVNADGYSDIVTGSGFFDVPNPDQGAALCFLGGDLWPSATPAAVWTGSAANDYFGQSVAGAGDVDADGYADIVIGAFGAGGTGKAYIVRGGASGPDAAPSWTFTGSTPGAAFGNSVSTAGDADGDGYSDVVVGEVFGSGSNGDAYLFRGGSAPSTTPWATYAGGANGDNLGHAVAGGGDVDGDGFGDLLMGIPRRTAGFYWEGGVRLVYANTVAGGAPQGHARPTFATRAGPGASPLAIYGRSRHPNAFGLASQASSAGGRDAVALEWRVVPRVGLGGSVQGRTAWADMNVPTAPLAGAKSITPQVNGLAAGGVYGWRTRVLSRSPWFRYGSWFTPQPNGRGDWDVRTILGPGDVPLATGAPAFELSAPWPNPSASEVRLDFALPAAGRVHAVVRDLQGRAVRTLADGRFDAGRHALQWDGADRAGRRAAAGIYFVEVASGAERRTARLVRLD